MAEYYIAPKSSFDATADAIREKTGSQATIEWTEDGFADAIAAIPAGGGDEPLIPNTYQRVEYIQGTGSGAVIDTGFTPDDYTSAILKFEPLVVTGDSLFGTMGVMSGDKDKWRVFNYSSALYFDCGNGSGGRMQIASWLPVNTQRYVSVGNKWIIDMTTGQEKTGATAITFADPITTHIFINGGAQDKSANAKWYEVKIFNGSTPARDFVPCYRKSDSVVGLYDRVTETFFTNVGSGGSFTAGPDVVSANDLLLILLGGAS